MSQKSHELTDVYLRAAKGEPKAVGELLFVHLNRYFCGIIKKYFPAADDFEVEEILHAFLEYIFTPTGDGSYRLRNLDGGNNPKTYLGRMCDNFLNDYKARRDSEPKAADEEIDPVRLAPADDQAHTAPADIALRLSREDAEVRALLKALESTADLGAEERYILLTYLLSERFSGTGRPLKLDVQLARQLGKNQSTVYNTYDRRLKKMRAVARIELNKLLEKDSDIFPYTIP